MEINPLALRFWIIDEYLKYETLSEVEVRAIAEKYFKKMGPNPSAKKVEVYKRAWEEAHEVIKGRLDLLRARQ